jgi:hypothetical protein
LKTNFLRFKTKYSGIVKYDNCEESVFRKYLNSKVSLLYTISPTHSYPEIGSMVGIFKELLLTV